MAKKVLMFLDSLISGGKERRAIELFYYLKENTDFELQIVLVENIIQYEYVYDINIPIVILRKRTFKKDPSVFYSFYKIVKKFKPDIVHAWSAMSTFYAIPTVKYYRIPLINGEIANAVPKHVRSIFKNFLWRINSYFSTLIIANSKAGIREYGIGPEKSLVIYNGVRLDRFERLSEQFKSEIRINTRFSIIMVASFGNTKDYQLYFNIAKKLLKLRKDVTFIAVGDGENKAFFENEAKRINLDKFVFTGRISYVEKLINVCDIGVLFSNKESGEGISNALMEYMALSKPVVATNVGGTNELVDNEVSGYLVNSDEHLIVEIINKLLDCPEIRNQMGDTGRRIIENNFRIDQMGKQFVEQYRRLLKG